jgi:DNA repair photolyase
MKKKTNMYSLSVAQFNPFIGCKFNCVYCKNSFQSQLKRWAKKNCQKCYNFEPHEHPERLNQWLPPTDYMQFIFTCSMGDISFCSTEYLEKIVDRIRKESDKTFLIQSKNPKTFERIAKWPNNVILGTTIETNREYANISKAPSTKERINAIIKLRDRKIWIPK